MVNVYVAEVLVLFCPSLLQYENVEPGEGVAVALTVSNALYHLVPAAGLVVPEPDGVSIVSWYCCW
jgi:hypothetical protein